MKLNRLCAFLIFSFLFKSVICSGQNFSFINFTNNDGLPQSQVQAIEQDEEGFLWIGTLGGLSRFNGLKFNSYSAAKGLLNNRVTAVYSSKKSIYIGYQGGISILKGNKIRNFALPSNFKIARVVQFAFFKKVLYVASDEGLFSFCDGKFKNITLQANGALVCNSILVFNNQLYIGTQEGLYTISNQQLKKEKEFGVKSISKLHLGKNKLLISTFNEGVYTLSHTLKLKKIKLDFTKAYITDILEYENNCFLITSDLGLIQIVNEKNSLIAENKGLPISGLNTLFEDDEKNIWIGTDGKGLVKIGDRNVVYFNRKTGLQTDLALAIFPFGKNKFLLGSYDQGLFEMDTYGNSKKLALPSSTIWAIQHFEGKYYFGSDMGLFASSSGKSFQLIPINGDKSTVRVVKLLDKDRLLVCSEEEMILITRNGKINALPGFKKAKNYLGLVRDAVMYNGQVWLGTTEGLFCVDQKTGKFIKKKKFNSYVASMAVDSHNCLWIGTESGCFRYQEINFESLDFSENSSAQFINFINFQGDFAYIGTNDGLYVLLNQGDDLKPSVVNHLGIYNGLSNLESNINASLIYNNSLWFGTADALNRLDINSMPEINLYLPRIKIRDVLVNYKGINWYGFGKAEETSLSLSYNKNNISVQLDAIYLKEPKTLKFQYWMEGLEEKWSLWDPSQNIQFSNLPSGDYVLHMRAKSESGSSSKELKFHLKIRTPFWEKWWFFALIAGLIYLSIRFYLRLQIKRERNKSDRERLINESKLMALEQKSLNASMNRHFIFNSLNSIQYFIMTQDRISANKYLSSFAKLIRKNLDSASEQNTMVSLTEEIERLELYLSLESMRFKDRFDYEINIGDLELEHVEVPAMLLQPFVENSIIHGVLPIEDKKGLISINVTLIENQLEIRIDDNGVGINSSKENKSKTKGDHTSRGMEITLNRIELIRTILKKDFQLIGPFQMEDENRLIKGTRVLIKIPYENLDY